MAFFFSAEESKQTNFNLLIQPKHSGGSPAWSGRSRISVSTPLILSPATPLTSLLQRSDLSWLGRRLAGHAVSSGDSELSHCDYPPPVCAVEEGRDREACDTR